MRWMVFAASLTCLMACGQGERIKPQKAYDDTESGLTELRSSLLVKTCEEKNTDSAEYRTMKAIAESFDLSIDLPCDQLFSKLRHVQKIDLSFKKISSVSLLKDFGRLEVLDLSKNFITNVDDLSSLTKLKILSLSENMLEDANIIQDLTHLESLNLANNRIKEMPNLTENEVMEFLEISGNEIASINFLKNLTELKTLSFMDNRVTDLSPLMNLGNLETLQISRNPISKGKCKAQLLASRFPGLVLACNQLDD